MLEIHMLIVFAFCYKHTIPYLFFLLFSLLRQYFLLICRTLINAKSIILVFLYVKFQSGLASPCWQSLYLQICTMTVLGWDLLYLLLLLLKRTQLPSLTFRIQKLLTATALFVIWIPVLNVWKLSMSTT